MAKVVGYARVSTAEQELGGQLAELEAAGCVEVFTDTISGARGERPGLDECLASLGTGDTLVVWRLDRLGRSLSHLAELMGELKERQVGVRSLRDGVIDTTTASGELIFHIFAAMAQFERELIRERTMAGLAAARAEGRTGGRPPVRPDHPKVRMVKSLHEKSGLHPTQICAQLGISKSTYYRYLKLGSPGGSPPSEAGGSTPG
jgi:DNA invertase Pin-like site-specific DNA recombinase